MFASPCTRGAERHASFLCCNFLNVLDSLKEQLQSREKSIMRLILPLIAVNVLCAFSASAHHSPAGFNMASVVAIQGRVSRVDWGNPHVYFGVETTNDAGEALEWLVETDPTSILIRNGWTAESLTPGDRITLRAHPDRNAQRNHALLISVATESGVVLTPRSSGVVTASPASSLSGVWDAMRGFSRRPAIDGVLTEKGRVADAAFSELDSPVANCVPHPAPFLHVLPYLNEIEVGDDTVTIRSEFFRVDRVVYMDGRGHPGNGVASNQGHSIGWWEDEVLVVDTTLFEDHRTGNRAANLPGVPSGAQKHVIERYELSPDATRLTLTFSVEDPEYLAEPMTGSVEWDYAPGFELLRFDCDPEIASRYRFQ